MLMGWWIQYDSIVCQCVHVFSFHVSIFQIPLVEDDPIGKNCDAQKGRETK